MRTCSVEGCERKHVVHGYCEPHARRVQKHGHAGPAEIKVYTQSMCVGPGCDRRSVAHLLCGTHYDQRKRGKELTVIRLRQGTEPRRSGALRYIHGITQDQYNARLAEQDGVCALCGEINASGRDLAVDHDHACCPGRNACGRCIRGLLCSRCNVGLGNFRDRPDLLLKAVEYLRG